MPEQAASSGAPSRRPAPALRPARMAMRRLGPGRFGFESIGSAIALFFSAGIKRRCSLQRTLPLRHHVRDKLTETKGLCSADVGAKGRAASKRPKTAVPPGRNSLYIDPDTLRPAGLPPDPRFRPRPPIT